MRLPREKKRMVSGTSTKIQRYDWVAQEHFAYPVILRLIESGSVPTRHAKAFLSTSSVSMIVSLNR